MKEKYSAYLNFGNHKYNVSIIKWKMPSIYCSSDNEKHNIWMAKIIVEKTKKSCWHTVYSYGKIINVAERAAGKYDIGADLASEKNKKTSWHKWSDVIIYKSCWRRTIRTIEIRSERKVKKFLTDEIRNDII